MFPTMEFFKWTPGDFGETVPNFKEELELRPPGRYVANNPPGQLDPVAEEEEKVAP